MGTKNSVEGLVRRTAQILCLQQPCRTVPTHRCAKVRNLQVTTLAKHTLSHRRQAPIQYSTWRLLMIRPESKGIKAMAGRQRCKSLFRMPYPTESRTRWQRPQRQRCKRSLFVHQREGWAWSRRRTCRSVSEDLPNVHPHARQSTAILIYTQMPG